MPNPTISNKLLNDALDFAKMLVDIDSNTIINAIMHLTKSLLLSKDDVYVKKDNSTFDLKKKEISLVPCTPYTTF